MFPAIIAMRDHGHCGTQSGCAAPAATTSSSATYSSQRNTFSFQDPQLIRRSGPLYAFPFMFIAKGPATALGIAHHAIDTLIGTTTENRRGATRSAGLFGVACGINPIALEESVLASC